MIDFNDQTVTQIFEQQALSHPERTAVFDQSTALTYRQLNEKANDLAHYLLHKEKVSKGEFVALLLEPDVDFIVCILGIIKAGAAYLPLDVFSPKKRLEKVLNHANPRILLIDEKHDSVEFAKWPRFSVKNLQSLETCFPAHNPVNPSFPSNPIYMLYTSGSTGEPKGVLVPHRAVVNITKTTNYFLIDYPDVVAQFINLAFDPSALEIWGTLLNGATLCIIPLTARGNYQHLKNVLAKNWIDHLILPTSYFHQLIQVSPDIFDKVRVLIFGGEPAIHTLIKKFVIYRKKMNLPIHLINAYGPTEATIAACRYVIEASGENDGNDLDKLVSIGTPIENVKTYILNQDKQPVIPGEVGELYISGINLALGYYNDEESNKEKFLTNLFDDKDPFKRLYRTGDLVKQLPNGNLIYVGRTDDQIKIRGFRVDLNEIRNQLLLHPAISSAMIVPEKEGENWARLLAYIVFSDEGLILSSDEIRKYLSIQLSSYMLPTRYIKINEMPLTHAGKIDKEKLSIMKGIDLANVKVLPNNQVEQRLVKVFSALLQVHRIDVTKNLFDLGMNSLLLVQACDEIGREFQWSVPLEALITYPSIRKLSEYLRKNQPDYLTNLVELS